ncbi:hypothetical protein [Pseudotabrizicola formosa]|uniref:hypothetical protein n=1 Tax=Pseudotabrizicola formosa TaxID=2030009 RepID=UPI0011AF424B|nr:hypothetical protein [Pseudotabrizicola formosa]
MNWQIGFGQAVFGLWLARVINDRPCPGSIGQPVLPPFGRRPSNQTGSSGALTLKGLTNIGMKVALLPVWSEEDHDHD